MRVAALVCRGKEGAELQGKAKNSVYVPTPTYGHELLAATERVTLLIQADKIRFIPRVTGLSHRGRVRSLGIWRELLLLHLEMSQLGWFGHLIRMPPRRLLLEVFRACPTGGRLCGRPTTCWKDYRSCLAWERLGVPQEELESVVGFLQIYNQHDLLLP